MRRQAGLIGRGRKSLILGAVLVGHVILLAAAALQPPLLSTPHADPSTVTIALFDPERPRGPSTPDAPLTEQVRDELFRPEEAESVKAAAPLAPPTPPPLDLATLSESMAAPDPTDKPQPLSRQAAAAPLPPLPTSQPADSASTCQMVAILETALTEDATVTAALAEVPRKARSVANAIMLWDGDWVEPSALGEGRALPPIQAAIISIIQGAPADCHAQIVLGPRLISIPDARGATLLALGSGAWKWEDLLVARDETQAFDTSPARRR